MKIAIFNLLPDRFSFNSLAGPLGGSETWAIQLSDQFAKQGHDVTVLCNCGVSAVSPSGVRYVAFGDAAKLRGESFDFVITSRLLKRFFDALDALGVSAACVYAQLHDVFFYADDCDSASLADSRLKYIVCLTEWHRQYVVSRGVPEQKIAVIPDGIDPVLFEGINASRTECDHTVLWSSCFNRGIGLLADAVAPIVRSSIPDFKVRAVTYMKQAAPLTCETAPGMGKAELYAEMAKHAVWFYPSVYEETFCMTAAENVMAGNDIVMHPEYGTTEWARLAKKVKHSFAKPGEMRDAADEAAGLIIDSIMSFGSAESAARRACARKFVENNYSWRSVADKYMRLFDGLGKAI